jgi:hypothetical protein
MGRRFAVGRRWRFSLLLLLLATVVVGPLLAPTLRATTGLGFLNTRGGGDSPFLLFRLGQLVTALADGHFPVRWMPDAAYGLGYPFFSYYAALPYYIGAALHFWGFGLVAAVKLTQWLGSVLAAWAMCGLVSRFGSTGQARGGGSNTRFGRRTAWLAAAAYAFAPYHLVNIYVRGDSLTEFWAMGLYPLILWTAARLWDRPGRGRAILFSLSYAALILTHNISALIFSPFVLLFFILLAAGTPAPHRGWKAGATLAVGLVLGLALSAFFWLPALGEQGAVQLTAQTSGYYHYSNHFRTLASTSGSAGLIQSTLIFDYDVAGMTPFSMGLVQAILTAAGLIAALLRLCRSGIRSLNPLTLFALCALFISTVMITPASRPLWDHLPLLPMVQFPWRFLSVQALAAAPRTARLSGSGAGDLDRPHRLFGFGRLAPGCSCPCRRRHHSRKDATLRMVQWQHWDDHPLRVSAARSSSPALYFRIHRHRPADGRQNPGGGSDRHATGDANREGKLAGTGSNRFGYHRLSYSILAGLEGVRGWKAGSGAPGRESGNHYPGPSGR